MYETAGVEENVAVNATANVTQGEDVLAANDSAWGIHRGKLWFSRAAKVAGVVAASVVCYELVDMAM